MKILLAILNGFAGSMAAISGVSALLLLYGGTITEKWGDIGLPPVFGSLFLALLGLSMIIGIITAVASAFLGFVLAILQFIFKSWIGAFISLAVCASGAGLWAFFLSRNI